MDTKKKVVTGHVFWIIIQCMSFANQLNLKTLANDPRGTFINLAQSILKKIQKALFLAYWAFRSDFPGTPSTFRFFRYMSTRVVERAKWMWRLGWCGQCWVLLFIMLPTNRESRGIYPNTTNIQWRKLAFERRNPIGYSSLIKRGGFFKVKVGSHFFTVRSRVSGSI